MGHYVPLFLVPAVGLKPFGFPEITNHIYTLLKQGCQALILESNETHSLTPSLTHTEEALPIMQANAHILKKVIRH